MGDTFTTVGIILIMRHCDIDRGYVDLAISWHPDVGRYRARTHAGQHAVRLTMQNHDNCLKDGHLMLPESNSRPTRATVVPSLVVPSLVSPFTNIVTTALMLMCLDTYVRARDYRQL